MVTQTSMQAYRSIREKLGHKQLAVLEVIERHADGRTNLEICRELQWPINTVTPRVWELRTAGVIAEVSRRMDPSTRKWGKVWGVVHGKQAVLF